MPKPGLEPGRVSPLPPQDSVSTMFHHFGISDSAVMLPEFSLSSRRCGRRSCPLCLFRSRWRWRDRLLCRRLWRRFLCFRTAHGIHYRGPLGKGKIRQGQRREHEDRRHQGGKFTQESSGAAAAENRLTRPTEGRAHVSPLAGLKQHDQDQNNAYDDMQHGYKNMHLISLRNIIEILLCGQKNPRPGLRPPPARR